MNTIKANVKILQTVFRDLDMLLLKYLLVDAHCDPSTVFVVVSGKAAHQLRYVFKVGDHAAIEYELLINSDIGWLVRYAVRHFHDEWIEMEPLRYGPAFANQDEYKSSGYVHIGQGDSFVAIFPFFGYKNESEETDLESYES